MAVTWSKNTPIIGPSHGKISDVKALCTKSARLSDVYNYIDTVYSLCYADDMPDAAVVIAQAFQECSDAGIPFNSYWWRQRLNPAGIGITGDPAQNNASRTFKTGAEAARAHVAHLLLYATGKIDRGGLKPADDPRYAAYHDAYGAKARATTIGGLTNTWAMDDKYDVGIVGHLNRAFKNADVSSQTPTTPTPSTPTSANFTVINGTKYYKTDVEVEFIRDALLFQWATPNAVVVSQEKKGAKRKAVAWVSSEVYNDKDDSTTDEPYWYVLDSIENGPRVPMVFVKQRPD